MSDIEKESIPINRRILNKKVLDVIIELDSLCSLLDSNIPLYMKCDIDPSLSMSVVKLRYLLLDHLTKDQKRQLDRFKKEEDKLYGRTNETSEII